MIVTKDALLADLARALQAKHAESADQMLSLLEPALASGSPQGKSKKTAKSPPKKLSGAVAKYSEQAAAALVVAFPDRGAALGEQLRMQVALGRIDRWTEAHRPDFHKELSKGADEKALAALEKKIGKKLPVAYHALFRWHDGNDGYSSFYYNNTFMSLSGVSSTWDVMHDLIPQFENDDGHKHWWHDGWVPFLENGGGDNVCVDLEGTFTKKKGQIMDFVHDDSPREVLFPDLPTWAEVFADSLEGELWEFSEEGDVDLKSEPKFKKLVTARAKGYPKSFDADED